jgi:hypothetical protein
MADGNRLRPIVEHKHDDGLLENYSISKYVAFERFFNSLLRLFKGMTKKAQTEKACAPR